MLGRRAKGGWVLSRFALHAPELSAEDPLVRLPRELITSAILPSLDATEDHDFDVIRRDDYIPSPHPPILLLYPCRATYRTGHSSVSYLMPALLSLSLPSLPSSFFLLLFFFFYLFISSALFPFPPLVSFPFSFFFPFFPLFPPPPFIISPDRSFRRRKAVPWLRESRSDCG